MNHDPVPGPGQNGMPPSHPAPVQQPQGRSTSALGITALVLGIIAMLTSFIPIVNNLSFLIGLLGLVLGIIGLVACVRGTKGGKGIAIAGVVLCALSLVVVLVTQSMFSAALDQSLSSAGVSSSASAASSTSASSSASAASATNTASKYVVSIDDCTLGTDYQGQDAAIVTFTFTNDSDSDTSFMVATNAQAFQNGVQLDTAISMDVDTSASMKEVKPGATVSVQKVYALTDMSPLTVEVEELINFGDDLLAEKTFTLQ